MTNQEVFYYVKEWQARPTSRRWWPKLITVLAVLGGVYGSALGSAISTTGAADVIGFAAAIMALICAVPGARFGFFFGMVNRVHFGRLFVGMFAAMGGTILGGFFGIVAVMPLGAILGAVCGWFFTRAVLQWGFFKKLAGLLLGACVGATVLALRRDQAAALVGIAWGTGIGVVVGPLLFLLFIKTLNSLPHWQDREGNVIEATVVDVSNDEEANP